MGKNRDLVVILLIVILGMFIPFLGSLLIMFELDVGAYESWMVIVKTFGWFLFIFVLELGAVYLYFTITNNLAQRKIDQENNLKNK